MDEQLEGSLLILSDPPHLEPIPKGLAIRDVGVIVRLPPIRPFGAPEVVITHSTVDDRLCQLVLQRMPEEVARICAVLDVIRAPLPSLSGPALRREDVSELGAVFSGRVQELWPEYMFVGPCTWGNVLAHKYYWSDGDWGNDHGL
jgi:hypothetical protein